MSASLCRCSPVSRKSWSREGPSLGLWPKDSNRPVYSRMYFAMVLFPVYRLWLRERPGWPRFRSVRLAFAPGTFGAVPVCVSDGSSRKGFFCALKQWCKGMARLRFRFRLLKTVLTVPVPISVPGKMAPTVPVSSSGLVPAPSWKNLGHSFFLLSVSRSLGGRFGYLLFFLLGGGAGAVRCAGREAEGFFF